MPIVLLSLLLPLIHAYTVTFACGPCSSAPATNCLFLNNGLFDSLQASIGPQYTACSQLPTKTPATFTVLCTNDCQGCSITVTTAGASFSICRQDSDGTVTVNTMNHLYGIIRRGEMYDWCGQAGCGNGPGLGLTLGLAFGGVILTTVLTIFVVCSKTKQGGESVVLRLNDSGKGVDELM